jgi:thiamine biosynthesis lipoprotein
MTEGPLSAEFAVWGGRAVVAVTDPSRLDDAVNAVQRVVEAVDAACSSFRDDSELAELNEAGGRTTSVSPLLMEYLQAGVRAAAVTDGDVDPTVGRALVALGFMGKGAEPRPDFAEPARLDEPARLKFQAVPGYRTIELNPSAGAARLAPGVRVDLGATAKAMAADQAAAAAHEATGAGVLVSLSGDLAIAGAPPSDAWRVRVTDDHRSDPGVPGQWISLTTGGLATSSTTVRVREHALERLHHVIDPRTGGPAAVHFRTVSVAAASCLDANIASTAAIVRGAAASSWLESLRLPSRLVTAEGTVLHLAGWPSEGEELPVVEPAAAGTPA